MGTFVAGIRSMFQPAIDAAEAIFSAIASRVPHSPVKEGPLRVFNNGAAGKKLVQMGLIDGFDASRADVAAAADRLAAQVDFTTRAALPTRFVFEQGGAAAGPNGAGVTVQVLGDVWGKPSDYIDQLMAGVDEALTLSRLRDAVQA